MYVHALWGIEEERENMTDKRGQNIPESNGNYGF